MNAWNDQPVVLELLMNLLYFDHTSVNITDVMRSALRREICKVPGFMHARHLAATV